jgi:hypothetical protein
MRTLNIFSNSLALVSTTHNDGGRPERPSVLSMSSRSRNRSETSREPASTPARSPLSLSKSRDSQAASDSDDDDTRRPRQHSRIDADESREGPSAPTSSTQWKADNDDVSAPAALPFSLSLTLQNTGSVARDHLASERTFLAYVRTSLSFASAGVGTSSPALPASMFFFSAFFFFFFFFFQNFFWSV